MKDNNVLNKIKGFFIAIAGFIESLFIAPCGGIAPITILVPLLISTYYLLKALL